MEKAKVIRINTKTSIVELGGENGEIENIPLSSFEDIPGVGDSYEIYRNEDKIVAHKITSSTLNNAKESNDVNNINVNIENTNYNRYPVNKIAYIVCALLLGGLGIHKFIAGKIGTGVLFLIFSCTFIPAIIGFIEGIVAISYPADENGNIFV